MSTSNNNNENETMIPIDINDENQNDQTKSVKPSSLNVQQSAINLESPTIFKIHEHEQESTFWNIKVISTLRGYFFVTISPLIFLILAARFHDKINITVFLGILVEWMFVFYFCSVGYLFWTGSRNNTSLFRVWTKTNQVPGWTNMYIATEQQIFKYEAIQSISEFSAIAGGVSSFMLNTLGCITWTVIIMHFAEETQCNEHFKWDIVDILEIIGVAGLLMIGMFELDPFNRSMKFFHYMGALAGTGTVWGYFVQQISISKHDGNPARLVTPIILGIVCFTGFILWRVFNKWTAKYETEIKTKYKNMKPTKEERIEISNELTKYSLKNVIAEGVFLFMGATAVALWLIDYHQNCEMGCSGPIDDE